MTCMPIISVLLLDVEHASQYEVEDLGGERLVSALRLATALVA